MRFQRVCPQYPHDELALRRQSRSPAHFLQAQLGNWIRLSLRRCGDRRHGLPPRPAEDLTEYWALVAQNHDHLPSHVRWSQAVFTHRFPIAGPHRVDCSECHQAGGTREFSCIHCHEHGKAKMDDKHDEEPGYVYNSQACYSCHPDGREH